MRGTWSVAVGEHAVTGVFDAATHGATPPVFLFAHGAGGNLGDRLMLALTKLLCSVGLHVVRFNFPYAERNGRRPDPMPLLQDCIAAVAARARREIDAPRWILGGRSMGGRAASMLIADGYACDGLLLLAYPLHPAGHPDKLRDAHLSRIAPPVLCFNGTRDALCERALMDAVVARLPSDWTMHWLDGADHSFHVTRSSGRDDPAVLDEIGKAAAAWLSITNPQAADRRNLR